MDFLDQRQGRVHHQEQHMAGAIQETLLPCSCLWIYEWQKIDEKTRKLYVFTVADSSLFAMAGLWDAWKDEQGHWLQSFSIVTTEANELMSSIHTRMPVILHKHDYDRWLSREVTEQLPLDLLRPFESEDMEMAAANQAVGNVQNNHAGLMTNSA